MIFYCNKTVDVILYCIQVSKTVNVVSWLEMFMNNECKLYVRMQIVDNEKQ